MKWKAVVGGAVLGFGWGIVMLVVAYAEAPSLPGSSSRNLLYDACKSY